MQQCAHLTLSPCQILTKVKSRPALGTQLRRACTLVTARPAMPQGVMAAKGARSGHTFSAMPWYAIHRRTRTPIAATLAPRTHTPVSPGSRSPRRPDTSASALRAGFEDIISQVGCHGHRDALAGLGAPAWM